MTYEFLTVAVQKMWEGFFWTIGVGIAAALVVGIIVGLLQKWVGRVMKTKTGKLLSTVWVGLHGNNSRERVASRKKKALQ